MITLAKYHPDSPLIDGAIPHSGAERVDILLTYALSLMPSALGLEKYRELRAEYREHSSKEIPRPPLVHPENEYEFWPEVEDEAIDLITDLLPDDWYCTIHPDDPGTVVIGRRSSA